MTIRKKIFALLTVFILSPLAIADGPGWTGSSTVIKLIVTTSGNVNVRLSPELNVCLGWGGYGQKYATLYTDHNGFDSIYSGLLAAYMSGKKVSIFLSDNTCRVGEVVLGGTHAGAVDQ